MSERPPSAASDLRLLGDLEGVSQHSVDDHAVRPHHQLARALDLELELDRRAGEDATGYALRVFPRTINTAPRRSTKQVQK